MHTLRAVLWLCLAAAACPAQSRPSAPTLEPAPRGWTDEVRTEIHADLVVRGRILLPDHGAIERAILERGAYVKLRVQVMEILKGTFTGKSVPLTFFAAPHGYRHRFVPTAEDMRSLIGQERVVFLVRYTGQHYFLADRTAGTAIASARRDSIASIRRRIALHAEQENQPPLGEAALRREVRELLDLAVQDRESQVRAFMRLEGLGREALPALIGALDDDRPLPEQHLVLQTRSEFSWMWLREYRPRTVADGLCALLHEMTGESFGLDYGRPKQKQREREHRGWNVYGYYLQRELSVARAELQMLRD